MPSYLSFTISDERYALPAASVKEVLRLAWPSPVAESPPSLLGVLNLAGQLVAMIDPALRLGLNKRPLRESDFLLLLDRQQDRVALRVQSIDGLIEGSPRAPPPHAELPAFVSAFLLEGSEATAILDADQLLEPSTQSFIQGLGGQRSEERDA